MARTGTSSSQAWGQSRSTRTAPVRCRQLPRPGRSSTTRKERGLLSLFPIVGLRGQPPRVRLLHGPGATSSWLGCGPTPRGRRSRPRAWRASSPSTTAASGTTTAPRWPSARTGISTSAPVMAAALPTAAQCPEHRPRTAARHDPAHRRRGHSGSGPLRPLCVPEHEPRSRGSISGRDEVWAYGLRERVADLVRPGDRQASISPTSTTEPEGGGQRRARELKGGRTQLRLERRWRGPSTATTRAACLHGKWKPVAEYTHSYGNCSITRRGHLSGVGPPAPGTVAVTFEPATARLHDASVAPGLWMRHGPEHRQTFSEEQDSELSGWPSRINSCVNGATGRAHRAFWGHRCSELFCESAECQVCLVTTGAASGKCDPDGLHLRSPLRFVVHFLRRMGPRSTARRYSLWPQPRPQSRVRLAVN